MDEDFEIIARAAGVLADEALFIGLGDGGEERLRLADELAANVDIGGPRAHGETGDQRALDQLVRIVANDLAVLARPRLRLVGVDDEKARAARLRLLRSEEHTSELQSLMRSSYAVFILEKKNSIQILPSIH